MLEHALRYLGLGYSVIPVNARKKGGAPFPWAEFQKHRPTRKQLEEWFASWKDGIAIITGAVSRLVVLDLDVKGEHDGRQIVTSLYGWEPEGPLARTGGGGTHALYAHPGRPVRNAVALHPGVDVRGDGGFVYAPPSPHPSGGVYEWITAPWEAELPPCPAWLLDALAEPASGSEDAQENLDALLRQGVPEGQRNETAAKIAGSYIAMGVGPDATLAILEGWNRNNQPPLPMKELHAVVRSIAKREAMKKGKAIEVNTEDERTMVLQALSERFGILIDDIERVGGSDPFYRFTCGSQVVEIAATKIIAQPVFRSAIVAATKRIPALVGAKAKPSWDYYCQQMLDVARDVDPGEEATLAGELRMWIASYLEQCKDVLTGDRETDEPNYPLVVDGRVYVYAQALRHHAEAQFGVRLEHKQFCQRLRAEGFAGAERMHVPGKRTTRSLWCVPKQFVPDGLLEEAQSGAA